MEKPTFRFAVRQDLSDVSERFLPRKGEPAATGYDVFAAPNERKDITIYPGQYFRIPLGFRAFPPAGWWFQLHPRSSSFVKRHVHALIGIIDEHFPLEAVFAGQFIPDSGFADQKEALTISFGEGIGQIVPVKRVEMEAVSISNDEFDALLAGRASCRSGGWGSTG